jgi:hypothetical protein
MIELWKTRFLFIMMNYGFVLYKVNDSREFFDGHSVARGSSFLQETNVSTPMTDANRYESSLFINYLFIRLLMIRLITGKIKKGCMLLIFSSDDQSIKIADGIII